MRSSPPPGETGLISALHVSELAQVPDPIELVVALRHLGMVWLLDSAQCGDRLGRFSFVGADPYLLLRARGSEARLDVRRCVRPDLALGTTTRSVDPLDLARSLMPERPAITSGAARCPVPFVGGAVGSWGYELGASTQAIELHAPDDLGLPDLVLLFVDRLVAVDHLEARAWVLGLGFDCDETLAGGRARDACGELEQRIRAVPTLAQSRTPGAPVASPPLAPPGLSAFFDESSYAEAIREIADEIDAGNVYQANLTHRMELPLSVSKPTLDPLALYRELRELNPAPFAAYLELPGASILSSSPERFLRLDSAGYVESRPIKGTRPRGGNADEDRRLEQELRESEKDRAENLMIVDLVRNDLGRVCRVGSVEVPELMAIESYATVHQMVSTVTGCLREECDAVDLIRACFPPGSMTGAPKLSAMRIIDRLEPVRRGIYAGGLGYLDVRGGLDLSVVIRTLIVTGGRAILHVGGGIVADSDPVAEWQETLDKARPLLAALCREAERAEGPSDAAGTPDAVASGR